MCDEGESAMNARLLRGQLARPVEDLDDETVSAIAGSSVPATYAGLDELIQDWTP